MSRLLITGLTLTAIAVGAELVLAQLTHGRRAAPIKVDAVSIQQDSFIQRGFSRIGQSIQTDSLVNDMDRMFERR